MLKWSVTVSNPNLQNSITLIRIKKMNSEAKAGFHGVVVSTLDFESSDLGSTPGGTSFAFHINFFASN